MLSRSTKETRAAAKKIAKELLRQKSTPLIMALSGDLGSGKTFFTRSFLRALGVKEKVASPTFVIMREYGLSRSNYKKAYHLDVYRLSIKDMGPIGLKKILKEKNAIIIIEWAEKIKRALPKRTVWIRFSHGNKNNERNIKL